MQFARSVVAGTGCHDRLTVAVAAAMAFLHLLLAVFFVLTLFQARTALAAEPGPCGGANLVERLRRDAPDRLDAALQQAAATANGKGIFWRIDKPGLAPSWLFGTMHSADPRIARLPEPVSAAFDAAETVAVENVESLSQLKMAAAMFRLRDYAFLGKGETLDRHIAKDLLATLRDQLAQRDMPWKVARQLQPWLVAATISIPICDSRAQKAGDPVLDALIAERAQEAGKNLVGLETVEEQFKAVHDIPFQFHVDALNETLELGGLGDDMMETTKQLYLEGSTGMMMPVVRLFAPRTYEGEGYDDFRRLLLTNRNHRMAERAVEYLDRGNAFIAVGALHLPGDEGVVSLLQKAGFTLTPQPI